MKKFLCLALSLLMLVGLLAGCGKTGDDGTGGNGGGDYSDYLRLMWKAQIGTDSIFESPWRDLQCLYPYMVFDSLLSYEADGSIVYKLASDHTVSEDGLTYTFTIRDGVKWHDGTDMTAEDVAFSLWGTLADPKASYKSGLSYIEGAADVSENGAAALSGVVVDGNMLSVTLTNPYGLFVSAIAKIYILPKHLLGGLAAEDISTNEEFWKKPVGTGAYKIDEVSFPDYCTLVANGDYWGPAPGIDNVLLTSYATGGADAVANALMAGELDFAYGNEVNDINVADNVASINSDIMILEMTSNYQRQFLFNWVESADGGLHPDMANQDVRLAINLLLDKDAIADIYGRNATALTSHLNPDSEMYDSSLTPFTRDVDTAVAMLDAAGFDYSKTLRIAYYYDDQTTLDVMDLVRQNLADGGITAETFLLSGDLGALIYEDRNYDMLYCGEAADDPGQMYFYLLGVGGYFDAIIGDMDTRETLFNSVIDQYNATSDFAEQTQLAYTLQQNGVEFCGIAPVVGINALALFNTARLSVPEEIFEIDWSTRDWKFESWSLTTA